MTRFVRIALLVLAGIILVVTPVFAYLYKAPVAITENASTSYDMLPVLWNQNNTWLAANGFMNSTANDTRVQTLGGLNKPWMVADNKTLTAIPVPANSQTNLYFTTGESEASAMDIIVGYGGYITRADDPGWELGSNFTIEQKGWIDTTATSNNNLVYKENALRVWVSGTGNVTAGILDVVEQTDFDAIFSLYNGSNVRYGQRIDAFTGKIISTSFLIGKVGDPTGTGYARVRDVTTDSILATFGSIDVAELTGSTIWHTFSDTSVDVSATNIRVVFEYSGGDVANYVLTRFKNSDVVAGSRTYYNAGWTDDASDDACFAYVSTDTFVTATGVASREHTVKTTYDGADLKIFVDDMVTPGDTAAWVGTVPGNDNAWVIMSNATPYSSYYQHTVNGTMVGWYQPTSMILTTVLPDRAGTAENGVITWGSNPAGVGTTLGSMVSSGQPGIGTTTDTSTGDILPVVGGTDWRPDAGVSVTLQANPMRPIVTAISDNTTLSEYQVWVWFGIIFVVFITILVGASVRGHHLITGIAASAAIILLVVWTVFPWWVLTVIVLAIWGGLVSERSPSL